MAQKNITVGDYAAFINKEISEIIKTASAKGIDIPNNPQYVINDSTLNLIDPISHFNIKYGKTETDNKPFIHIAVVLFFDDNINQFGKIVTNALRINRNIETNTLGVNNDDDFYELKIKGKNWKSTQKPKEGEWITMNLVPNQNGYTVQNGERLTYDKNGLKLAFPYRGKFSKIKRSDIENKYDYNIICHVIDTILEKTNGKKTVIDAFTEYLSSVKPDMVSTVINEFLADKDLLGRMIKLLPEIINVQLEVASKFAEAIFNNKNTDINLFYDLPDNFDFTPYLKHIIEVLKNSDRNNVECLLKWHPILKALLNNIHSLPIDLLQIVLSFVTKENAAFINPWEPWNETFKWLKEKNDEAAMCFLYVYFANKDSSFIEQNKPQTVLEYVTLKKLATILLDDFQCHKEILKHIAVIFIRYDFAIIHKYINHHIDLRHIYPQIAEYLNRIVKEKEAEVRKFLNLCVNNEVKPTDIMSTINTSADEMAIELFIQTADASLINSIKDRNSIYIWLDKQGTEFVRLFLQNCPKAFADNKATIAEFLSSITDTKFKDAITGLPDFEQYNILQMCTDDYSKNIIVRHFSSTSLFSLFINGQWKKLKSEMQYVPFDLETKDKLIREFAFRTDERTTHYKGEEQLETLLQALKRAKIIVGHNIKNWDIIVLKEKGYNSDAYIWDTLEMELLLSPCRHSYALHTKHTAQEDTDFVDCLFWNQLYRLSKNESLREELNNLLPAGINTIIEFLHQKEYSDYFCNYFKENNFFQELVDIDESVVSCIEDIETLESKALIIAPKRLWPKIAEHISLKFIQRQLDNDYKIISLKKLESKPLEGMLPNAILRRFVTESKTPIVANLGGYRLLHYFQDNHIFLDDYIVDSNGKVDCADIQILNDRTILKNYERVYFVGCEIENRINQYLETTYSLEYLLKKNINLAMRLAAANYIAISQEERKSDIFKGVPDNTANVWIEKTPQCEYSVNYNYDFHSIKESFVANLPQITSIDILENFDNGNLNNIFLVYTERCERLDTLQQRVSADSRYRATYWTYQFGLLNHITNCEKNHAPIIFILEDSHEIKLVESCAKDFNFYVPESDATLNRKLELIGKKEKGMLIVCKDQFFDIVSWRKDIPYCYVWDQMAVEKHRVMYGITDEKNKSFLNDGIDDKTGSTKETESVLLSIWPVYEYYYRLIKANNAESSMFVIDSFLEDYHYLASEWGVSSYGVNNLWENVKTYNETFDKVKKHFSDDKSIYINDSDIETAKDIILTALIKTSKNPNPQWSDTQKKILPKILKRENDYLVSLPTGGGKSVLFQGPALYNSVYTNKLSIVVTPLKALMQDQVKELEEKGFISNVDYLNGDRSYQEIENIYRKIKSGALAILYVTPERFRSQAFINALTTRMVKDNGLEYIVFDEAHCIFHWGLEFRPDYIYAVNECRKFKEIYKNNICIVMFSATATNKIYSQIKNLIDIKWLKDKSSYNPIRSHIRMESIKVPHDIPHRLKVIVNYIKEHNIDRKKSRMLVFCKTRKQCEELSLSLANELLKEGIIDEETMSQSVGYYHAGMDCEDRKETYIRFKDDDDPLYILCATKAFGMGMDIPNIHFIVHLMPPNSLEDYLQEVGRAGRNEAMYASVFENGIQIPTVCLYSNDDIKESRTQLLQDTLSWSDLEKIRNTVINYAKDKTDPIVVPNTLWVRRESDHDYTDFKVGLYWLERLNRIKIGHLSPTPLKIKIINKDSSGLPNDSYKVLERLITISEEQGTIEIQVSISELATGLSWPSTKILNSLFLCNKNKKIFIDQETRCQIASTRIGEVLYILDNLQDKHGKDKTIDNTSDAYAFNAILNATRSLLQNNGLRVERDYSLSDIRVFIKEAAHQESMVNVVIETDEDGNQTKKEYMKWYDVVDKQKNKNRGLSIAQSYYDDLYKNRLRQVMSLLEIVPDVKIKSYFDTNNKCIMQSVIVEKETWREFLDKFQIDCLSLLIYINEKNINFNWSEAIDKLGLKEGGGRYLKDLLRFMSGMGYIETDTLLQTGIEISTTEYSNDNIFDTPTEGSNDYNIKKEFDEAIEIRNLRLYVMECAMEILSGKDSKHKFQELTKTYFSCDKVRDYMTLLNDDNSIWNTLRETAIKDEEKKLNNEQKTIYDFDSNTNLNVEAVAGSGKTYILTLKCAKLIYREHVNPQSILILAYNRSVIDELKRRLSQLFASLGLSRSASQLHIHTFHGLAKKICGNKLEKINMDNWEKELSDTIKNKPREVLAAMQDIKYVLIDEFQDITQTRLDMIFRLNEIYNKVTFFTVGDKNQSIYGYERLKENGEINPQHYYEELYNKLKSEKRAMSINYRSYPKILEAAKKYLPEESVVPEACEDNKNNHPEDCVYINENTEWEKDFKKNVCDLKEKTIYNLAVFFRTNNEVYQGLSIIKEHNIPDVRIRIQGDSECKLLKTREIYHVLKELDNNCNKEIDNGTEKELCDKIREMINAHKNWDSFYMDFAFVLILNYIDSATEYEDSHTFGDMANSIRETLIEDNPQFYKIYDDERFENRRIFKEQQMNIVLTTMHRAKGLEFDAVIITPSNASLPFNTNENIDDSTPLSIEDKKLIMEERRLLYVAYTRAKKYLYVYKGERESAIELPEEKMERLANREEQWGIKEGEISLKNYNIGYNAVISNFNNNDYIANKVCKNDPVCIKRFSSNKFNIYHKDKDVGQLSNNSNIAKRMEKDNMDRLSGFFVSEVVCWDFKDTESVDKINGTDYAKKWSDKAKNQGYIYIVTIAGYGKEE